MSTEQIREYLMKISQEVGEIKGTLKPLINLPKELSENKLKCQTERDRIEKKFSNAYYFVAGISALIGVLAKIGMDFVK